MLSDLPQYAKHFKGTPRKHVSICTGEVDEHDFLFIDLLGAFHQLKDPSIALWL